MRIVLFLLFVIVPVIEIAVFIQVGEVIGVGLTLLGILATAIIGAVIVRHQGFSVLQQAREKMARQESPVEPVIHGVFILIAGLLLLTPGFFTDAVGFTFLVPPLRLVIAKRIMSMFSGILVFSTTQTREDYQHTNPTTGDAKIIDGVAIEVEPRRNKPQSG